MVISYFRLVNYFHPTETTQSTLPQQANSATIATVSYKLDQNETVGRTKACCRKCCQSESSVVCMYSLVFNCYLGYKNYRMYNIVKEYGILKPALMHHRDFMKSLDEMLNEDDIDDVLKRLEDSDKKSK